MHWKVTQMDQDTEVQTSQETDTAAAEAAFAASANDQPVEAAPVAEVVETPAPEAPAEEAAPQAPSPVTLTAEELAELRASSSKVAEFQTELRKAHGRIGALNDLLHQTMKAKEEAGKPAALTPMELKRTREEFPELAEFIESDMAGFLAANSGANPEAVAAMVEQSLAKQREEADKADIAQRQEELEEEHPDAREVFAKPEFASWFQALPEAERNAMQRTKSVAVLSRKLTAFKAWNAEQAAKAEASANAKQQSKKRLEAAITPTGVGGRQGSNVLSDREAAEKAFADASKF